MRLLPIQAAACAVLWAQSEPNAILDRARARIAELTRRLDRYVCVETVNRSYFSPSGPAKASPCTAPVMPGDPRSSYRLDSTDRLRVEVTVSESRELHSWPGATGFDMRDIDQLIGNGPVSTGSFALYLATIFGRPGGRFQYEGREIAGGTPRLRYRYEAPLEASRFQLKSGGASAPAPLDGEFWIDGATLNLGSLTARVSKIPRELRLCGVASTLHYQVLQIGDGQVLLPRRGELEIVHADGRASRNETTFASCREYQAESDVSFDIPPGEAETSIRPVARSRVALPLGLPVVLALETPIDSDSAATGDPVAARVVDPVRSPGSKEDLIPAGVMVHGRIRRMEHHLLPEPYFLFAIAFNRMELNGALVPFAARHEADPRAASELGAQLSVRATGIWFWDVGTFLFRTDKPRYVLPAGFKSKWFTLAIGSPQR
jgi:hypothetical protein